MDTDTGQLEVVRVQHVTCLIDSCQMSQVTDTAIGIILPRVLTPRTPAKPLPARVGSRPHSSAVPSGREMLVVVPGLWRHTSRKMRIKWKKSIQNVVRTLMTFVLTPVAFCWNHTVGHWQTGRVEGVCSCHPSIMSIGSSCQLTQRIRTC